MRWLTATAALAALTLSAGCAFAAAGLQTQDGYAVYFLEEDLSAAPGRDALRAETVFLDADEGTDTLAERLMTCLLEGPEDESLRSAVPPGTVLVSLAVDDGQAAVDLSSTYAVLSGVELTLADYAITLTLTQLPEISSVSITVRGRELAYRDKQVFTEEDVLRSSMEEVVSTVIATLDFPDEDGRLQAEERELELYEGETQAGAVVQALLSGPEDKELSAAVPEAFQVESMRLEESVCYVNLNSAALTEIPEDEVVETAVEALARSLCALDTVSEVQFLVDGEFMDSYGTVDVSGPWHY